MEITRKSQASGVVRTMDLPVTQEMLDRWQGGESIQKVMPHLNASEREFIMTGITDEEWNAIFWQVEEEHTCAMCTEKIYNSDDDICQKCEKRLDEAQEEMDACKGTGKNITLKGGGAD